MAPFGKKFLKARLKNRAEGKDGEAGREIQVWVQREEKTVCGLTKHSTCADVVQALLEDQGACAEPERGAAADHCLLERWKGFERPLPPLTRILRLWAAWGDEQPFVQFALVRACDRAPRPGDPAAGREAGERAPAEYARALPVDRQRRMVRKAFRKLERIRERERAPPAGDGRVSGLVQVIISQDRALREQALRMRELDLEIERAERGLGPAPDASPGNCEPRPADELEQLDAQLERHRDLVERLSRDIDAELWGAWRAGGGGEEPPGPGGGPRASADAAETERVRRELEQSMFCGLALHAQLAELERELELSGAVLGSQGQECEGLAAQLSALCLTDPADGAGTPCWTESAAGRTELQKALSQGDGADTDSDTGISSTHSQDSLSPCGDVRPPLETQV
ncbi:ras association domain-containing protein 9-like [Conger conger]|uniref:ras association domain-containing protein 9-like n=1 Tax=Conger conger TaxID=82655 RepID=UPI002A5B0A77|nr:ras association domain-containing protein 9-like [Conger conger]